MKSVAPFLVSIMFGLLVIACSSDNEVLTETLDVTAATKVPLNEQTPSFAYDESIFGIYHGVIASGNTLSRGKIWINIGNDTNYNATIELVGGATLHFGLKPQLTAFDEEIEVFEFEGSSGSFSLQLSDYNNPQISSVKLDGNLYFGSVVKSRSFSPASVITAIFEETGNPTFTGTWSLISDGTNPNPNGNGGDGITSLMITFNSEMYEDLVFDSFNASQCLGIPNYIPTINSYGIPNYTICDYQTTEFAFGMTKWNLGYDPTGPNYMNWILCEVLPSGTFSWTSSDNTIMRVGHIVMD